MEARIRVVGIALATIALLAAGAVPAVAAAPVANGGVVSAQTFSCNYQFLADATHPAGWYAGWSSTWSTVTQRPQQNDRVKEVQCLLKRLAAGTGNSAYDPGPIDGIFGWHTDSAVRAFQQGCFPSDPSQWDGSVGPNTWPCLRTTTV